MIITIATSQKWKKKTISHVWSTLYFGSLAFGLGLFLYFLFIAQVATVGVKAKSHMDICWKNQCDVIKN